MFLSVCVCVSMCVCLCVFPVCLSVPMSELVVLFVMVCLYVSS